jgi:broad specificity phosphatase PhoE
VRLAAQHGGDTVVVAGHGGIAFGSLIRLMDLPLAGRPVSFDPTNTGITEWLRVEGRWRLARYNDAAHLAALN